MRDKLIYFAAGALVSLVSVLATLVLLGDRIEWHRDRQAGSHVMLSAEDYMEISQLYGMYARDVDPGAVRSAAWMFTNDAKLALGSKTRLQGRKQIRNFYRKVNERDQGGDRHFNTSYVIVGMPDGTARGSTYMLGVHRTRENGPITIQTFGKYEDKLVRTPKGWRIQERVWQADTFEGTDQVSIPSPVPGREETWSTGVEERLAEREDEP